jgi:hypothetical protein
VASTDMMGEGFLVYAELQQAQERLAAATELLEQDDSLWVQWRSEDITEDEDRWVSFTDRAHRHHDAVVTFLANAPAAPTRADHERAVLEAMADAPASTVSLWAGGVRDAGWLSRLGWAVLAWREASR